MPLLDAILSVRKDAGLSQDEVARRMNVSPPVISRLERALLTGKPSPSIRTLQKYAKAVGKRLQISLVEVGRPAASMAGLRFLVECLTSPKMGARVCSCV